MEKSVQIGGNRTGIEMSPELAKQMVAGTEQYSPVASDGNQAYAALEGQYIRPGAQVGSMPPPGTVKGTLKTLASKLTGHNPEMFLNKLGERLAYERTGVRLYEAFIRKCEVLRDDTSQPRVSLQQLWQIRNEEEQHFLMLQECIRKMGADPTTQTPDADVSAVASQGIMQVLTDPRTSLSQCLEALLSIELIDNAAWELMIVLAKEIKQDEMTELFRTALQQEEVHLQQVRAWYQLAVTDQLNKTAAAA